MSFQIPPALSQSADYLALNLEQQRSIDSKLLTCEDLVKVGLIAASAKESELLSAVDDIQLDVLSIVGISSSPESTVSSYKIQSSWTFECDKQAMPKYIDQRIAAFLEKPRITCASRSAAKKWLENWANLVELTLDRFRTSSDYTEAVTHLIVIDLLLAIFLAFAASFRLSGST